jgi:hypothetical protein
MRVKVMGIWYCTREDVKSALDYKETARNNSQVDRAIEAASRSVERLTHRKFFPWTGTRYFNFPSDSFGPPSWKLWLGPDELISLSGLTTGGDTIDTSDTFLEPNDSGPPFTSLELNRSSSASFGSGNTSQRDIAITGVFGYQLDTALAGMLAQAVDVSSTTVIVSDASLVGVGSILNVAAERMVVTGRTQVSTSQVLQSSLTASKADVTVSVLDGTQLHIDEVITLNAERMLIVDILGNNLVVQRAWDGSTLAVHAGSTIYAPRQLTVERGALGTTAINHDTVTITTHQAPGPIRTLTIAEAISQIQQETSGYGRVVGSGDGQREASGVGLVSTRQEVFKSYGRRMRIGAV